jgi:hypothetical protein
MEGTMEYRKRRRRRALGSGNLGRHKMDMSFTRHVKNGGRFMASNGDRRALLRGFYGRLNLLASPLSIVSMLIYSPLLASM